MAEITEDKIDVAIIGAGVSGLYAGWRLAANAGLRNVRIFEMDSRIGGRLYTIKNFASTNMYAELGGMRYLEHHQMTVDMIKHLRLATEDFPMGTADHHLFYLRGKSFRASEWGSDGETPYYKGAKYSIGNNGRLLNADQIFNKIVDEILEANNEERPKNREGWDKIKSKLTCHSGANKGERLENVGFWNLIQEIADAETYEILAQAGGYYSNTINWNAAEALPYVVGDFSGDTKYKTLTKGLDELALALALVFRGNGGGIQMNSRLVKFDILEGQEYRYRLFFKEHGKDKTYLAKQIIMGLPRRSLELIEWPLNLRNNLMFKRRVPSVIGSPAFKLLMAFHHQNDKPWWELQSGYKFGRAITDLPMRQCYYFGTKANRSILLASYNDVRPVAFWKTLEAPHAGKFDLADVQNHLEMTDDESTDRIVKQFEPNWDLLHNEKDDASTDKNMQAPLPMVKHALAQLKAVHQLEDIPDPYSTAYINWGHDPYGGAYHAWKARFDVGAVMKYMRRPFGVEKIHIVGEAYSDQQGWVEGAFCITELMLEENFGLNRPAWLRKDYYLGR